MENISKETPLFVMTEGCEPSFFTRFFKWDSAKALVLPNILQCACISLKRHKYMLKVPIQATNNLNALLKLF